MRTRIITTIAVTLSVLATPCLASPMFTVTDLGLADPDSNYLSDLGPADQASFRSGSFDPFAHPATVSNLPVFYGNGDIVPAAGNSQEYTDVSMVTSNDREFNIGTAIWNKSLTGTDLEPIVVGFSPNPHTLNTIDGEISQNGSGTPVQSPGNLEGFPGFSEQAHNSVSASGVNDGGLIVGSYTLAASGNLRPLIDGLIIGTLGGGNAAAMALNNSSQVVGWSQVADGTQHAFLYTNTIMQDLNTLVPPLPGVVLNDAVGINASGQIVAFGTDATGATHEYLLTPAPIPEPSTVALIGLAICGEAFRRLLNRRRGMA